MFNRSSIFFDAPRGRPRHVSCSRLAEQTSGAALLLVRCLKRVAAAEARAINFVATSQVAIDPRGYHAVRSQRRSWTARRRWEKRAPTRENTHVKTCTSLLCFSFRLRDQCVVRRFVCCSNLRPADFALHATPPCVLCSSSALQAASPPLRAPRAEPCMAHLFKTNFVEFQGLLE